MSNAKTPKQPLSIYSVMLIVSAILMLAACILMTVEFWRYGSPWEETGIPTTTMNGNPLPTIGIQFDSSGVIV